MEYQEVRETVEAIIKAIEESNYSSDVEGPDNIEKCTAPDGRTFYKVLDMDGVKSSTFFGNCTVEVEGYEFRFDLENGDVESDFLGQLEESYELEDGTVVTREEIEERITDAFRERRDIKMGIYGEPQEQMDLFCHANGIKDDVEFYWWDDDDCPINIEDDMEDFTPPEDLGYGTVTYEGCEYYIVEEDLDIEEGEENVSRLHAVKVGETCDDQGWYPTVLLTLREEGDELVAVDCQECEERYTAVEGWVE